MAPRAGLLQRAEGDLDAAVLRLAFRGAVGRDRVVRAGTGGGAQTNWGVYAPLLANQGYCVYSMTYGAYDLPWPISAVGGMLPMVGDMWPPELPSHWMVYFAVEDTDAAATRSEGLGGKVVVPGFDTPAGRIAVLNDPVGAVFSIIRLARVPPGD